MTYTVRPRGVCAGMMQFDLDEAGVVSNLKVSGGCPGNSLGISGLVQGMQAEEVVRRLKGVRCGMKNTSCPDQLAQAMEKILAERQA